jgi:hypothetical protein
MNGMAKNPAWDLPMSDWLLLAAALGPPVAWAMHLTFRYPLVFVACRAGTALPLHVVTAVMGLASVACAIVGFIYLRRLPQDDSRELKRRRFLARSALVLGIFFLFVIIMEAMPAITGDPCLMPGHTMEEGQ